MEAANLLLVTTALIFGASILLVSINFIHKGRIDDLVKAYNKLSDIYDKNQKDFEELEKTYQKLWTNYQSLSRKVEELKTQNAQQSVEIQRLVLENRKLINAVEMDTDLE